MQNMTVWSLLEEHGNSACCSSFMHDWSENFSLHAKWDFMGLDNQTSDPVDPFSSWHTLCLDE